MSKPEAFNSATGADITIRCSSCGTRGQFLGWIDWTCPCGQLTVARGAIQVSPQ